MVSSCNCHEIRVDVYSEDVHVTAAVGKVTLKVDCQVTRVASNVQCHAGTTHVT